MMPVPAALDRQQHRSVREGPERLEHFDLQSSHRHPLVRVSLCPIQSKAFRNVMRGRVAEWTIGPIPSRRVLPYVSLDQSLGSRTIAVASFRAGRMARFASRSSGISRPMSIQYVRPTPLALQASAPATVATAARSFGLVRAWLWVVAACIFAMVVVGGATRLTQSGLSITEWKPVMGVLPPLNDAAWQAEFERYKQIPQYHAAQRRHDARGLQDDFLLGMGAPAAGADHRQPRGCCRSSASGSRGG